MYVSSSVHVVIWNKLPKERGSAISKTFLISLLVRMETLNNRYVNWQQTDHLLGLGIEK